MKQKLRIIIILLLSIVFVLSAAMICTEMVMRKREADTFEELVKLVEPPITNETSQINSNDTDTHNSQNNATQEKAQEKNISVLLEQNADCVGWLTIPESNINYPVMQTVNEPEKYLYKDFNGKNSKSGVPFIDYRCDYKNGNIIIYGHNMKNGTMFADLKKYRNNQYKKTHEIIYLQTNDGMYRFKVTEVKITDVYDEKYNELTANNTRTLLLSTCYGSNKDARIIIVAEQIA